MGFFGGASAPEEKSFLRTEWNQGVEDEIPGAVLHDAFWSASPSINRGTMFSYSNNYAGHMAVTINKNGVAGFNLSLGSQGASWGGLSLFTTLLSEDNGGVVDVFYELPVPGSGSLYPTASILFREVSIGQKYWVTLYLTGSAKYYTDINTLSAFSVIEV
jgi:hypothetical protein